MSEAGFDSELCFHPRLLGFFLLAIGTLHISNQNDITEGHFLESAFRGEPVAPACADLRQHDPACSHVILAPLREAANNHPNATALGFVMLSDATNATSAHHNVIALDAQLLDVSAAATYVQETVGVPLSPTDLESDVCAGRGPVHRKWGRQKLFRRSDLTAWAVARLSAPIHPRRSG